MAMSDLPCDLLEDILSRIPSESLRELRFTCKLWNALFKDRRCMKKRFQERTAREVIVVMYSSVYSLNFYPVNVERPNEKVMARFDLSSVEGNENDDLNLYHISDVFHCDGLLLLRTNRDWKNNRLVVWNPCAGKIRWIQPMNQNMKNGIFALGYHNELCDIYKVLRILDHPEMGFSEFEIYEFSSNSWRALDDVTLSCILQSGGVSLKGNTYWIASQVKDFLLLSFDFTTEKFGRLNLPSQCIGYEVLALSVVRDEQLSILQQGRYTSKVEIWVTTNDEINQTKVLSWIKFLAVDLNTYFHPNVTFFIADEEKKVVVCCDDGIAYTFGENRDFGKLKSSVGPLVMSQAWFKFNLEAIGNITIPHCSLPVVRKFSKT